MSVRPAGLVKYKLRFAINVCTSVFYLPVRPDAEVISFRRVTTDNCFYLIIIIQRRPRKGITIGIHHDRTYYGLKIIISDSHVKIPVFGQTNDCQKLFSQRYSQRVCISFVNTCSCGLKDKFVCIHGYA